MSGKMTQEDAARIQSANAKSGSDPAFASRAQSAADKSANAQGNTGKSGGGNNDNDSSGGKK